MKKKTKVVVTGGAGFIGSHIVDACVAKGWETHVIDVRLPDKSDLSRQVRLVGEKKARFHKIDLRNLKKIKPVIKGAAYVFHVAALPRVQYSIDHPVETTEANVIGTMNVLIAATEGKVKRVIYSASSSAYGDQPTLPLQEKMKENPKSPYALQKFVGELYCKVWSKVFGLETVSLRYFNVYGPRMTPKGSYPLAIAVFLDQKKRGKPMTITGNGKQTRDFTHVTDVVHANMLAATSGKVGKGEVFNIGAGNNVSMNQIANLIGGAKTYIPARLEPKDTLADNTLAKKILGWTPKVKIEKGIADLKKLWEV